MADEVSGRPLIRSKLFHAIGLLRRTNVLAVAPFVAISQQDPSKRMTVAGFYDGSQEEGIIPVYAMNKEEAIEFAKEIIRVAEALPD